jgi:hypothetical protein
LVNVYKKPVLWRRSDCVLSCGGAPLEIIKQYIQQQNRPDNSPALRAGRYPPPSNPLAFA